MGMQNKLILVVEDEAAIRDIMAKVLRAAGYNVLLAANGGEAIGIASSERLDLLTRGAEELARSGVRQGAGCCPERDGPRQSERVLEIPGKEPRRDRRAGGRPGSPVIDR